MRLEWADSNIFLPSPWPFGRSHGHPHDLHAAIVYEQGCHTQVITGRGNPPFQPDGCPPLCILRHPLICSFHNTSFPSPGLPWKKQRNSAIPLHVQNELPHGIVSL